MKYKIYDCRGFVIIICGVRRLTSKNRRILEILTFAPSNMDKDLLFYVPTILSLEKDKLYMHYQTQYKINRIFLLKNGKLFNNFLFEEIYTLTSWLLDFFIPPCIMTIFVFVTVRNVLNTL